MRRWRNLPALLLAFATVAGTWGELRILARSAVRHVRSWGRRAYCSAGGYIDLPRRFCGASRQTGRIAADSARRRLPR